MTETHAGWGRKGDPFAGLLGAGRIGFRRERRDRRDMVQKAPRVYAQRMHLIYWLMWPLSAAVAFFFICYAVTSTGRTLKVLLGIVTFALSACLTIAAAVHYSAGYWTYFTPSSGALVWVDGVMKRKETKKCGELMGGPFCGEYDESYTSGVVELPIAGKKVEIETATQGGRYCTEENCFLPEVGQTVRAYYYDWGKPPEVINMLLRKRPLSEHIGFFLIGLISALGTMAISLLSRRTRLKSVS